jgi:hypothetical protein
MAAFVVAGELRSGRTACRCLRLARSSLHYQMRPPTSERTRLVTRLHELSRKYPRYGFRRIAVKLREEGYQVGRKQVQKLRRAAAAALYSTPRCLHRAADAANHRGHVGLSKDAVQRLWSANDLKPHRTRMFKLSNDPHFEKKF